MNTLILTTLSSSCLLGLLVTAAAQTAAPPTQTPSVQAAPATQAAPQPAASESTAPKPTPASAEGTATMASGAKTSENAVLPDGLLRMNFRNAPLESVLNYLSDAAGFIIFPKTELKGKVTVWSNQPVTKEEALQQLYSALDENGYTAVRNGRTLTIYNKEDAKKQNLPVKVGNNPEAITANDQMVTQIIPVRFIDAVQVSRDLQPLLPDKATMTANQGGNAIIITDAQANIRHMVEIIKALDTAISSVSSVKVFPLKYADSKSLAAVLKDLFAPQDSGRQTGNNAPGGANRFMNFMRGGGPGGFGGRGGGNQGGGNNAGADGRAPQTRVVAVAEERSNSVVVSAPDDQMPLVEDVIRQVDTNVQDITELKVFHLHFADAQETADLISNLFSDQGSTSSNNQGFRGPIMFGGRFGGGFGGGRGAGANGDQSSRLQKEMKVVAVPDLRTGSVVVSAARDLMVEIAKMVDDLDADPAKKQQVYVFDVQNTDPQQVLSVLQGLFPSPNNGTLNSRSMNNQQNSPGNQLNSRATQQQNQGYNRIGNNSGFGGMSSGLGSGLGR